MKFVRIVHMKNDDKVCWVKKISDIPYFLRFFNDIVV